MRNKPLSTTVKETYALYSGGLSVKEIAEIRKLVESTIYTHIADLISRGLVKLGDVVGEWKIKEILKVLNERSKDSLSEIKSQLGDSFTYGEIKCVRAFTKLQDNETPTQKLSEALIREENKNPKEVAKQEIFTVGELTKYIKNLLESDRKLNNLLVRGEISNLKYHNSGHIYFSLKDKESQIDCALFKRVGENLEFELKHGMKVIIGGNIEVYKPRGNYELIVEEIQPDGLGSLNLAFIQLKEKLEKEGLFLDKYKKKIPKFPKTIGIITSPTGAVIQDMLNIIKRRYPLVEILIIPTPVQGKKATNSIVQSIELMNELSEVDCIILGRGGGSLEDLWCFNEEKVARAIFESDIPIISAIGHETDFTISDFVADYRAPTPSAAAEKVVPDIEELYEDLYNFNIRIIQAIKHLINFNKSYLKQILNRPLFKRPFDKIHDHYKDIDHISYELKTVMLDNIRSKRKELEITESEILIFDPKSILKREHKDLDHTSYKLQIAISSNLKSKRKELEIIESKIYALNPKSILKRGYSIVMKNSKIIKDSFDVKIKDKMEIILHKGKLNVQVKKIQKDQNA